MPYVAPTGAPNLPSVDLQAVRAEMGAPPWRKPLIASPATRWVLISWPAGFVSVPHHHPRGEEVFYVLAGTAMFRFGDGAAEPLARPGTLLVAPRGVVHTIGVPGPEPLVFLASVAPNEDADDETVEDLAVPTLEL
ncbi:MAG: cupin domain-containing protein [Chloroflexi bacterium]|nr:cupin domain-containing protein [Chloroflexota bacterium]